MAVAIKLVGFGDDRPPRFDEKSRLQLKIETPTSVRDLLSAAGIEESDDLIAMNSDTVIPRDAWDDQLFADGSSLTVLSAIEGG